MKVYIVITSYRHGLGEAVEVEAEVFDTRDKARKAMEGKGLNTMVGFVGNGPVLVRQETDNKLLVGFLGDAWCPDVVEEWVKRIERNKNKDIENVNDSCMFGVIENDRERRSSDFYVSFYYRG